MAEPPSIQQACNKHVAIVTGSANRPLETISMYITFSQKKRSNLAAVATSSTRSFHASQPRHELQRQALASLLKAQGNPRRRRPPFPINGRPVPVAPVTRQTGTGVTGTGALRGRGVTAYGGWAYGVPMRTGVRDLKKKRGVNPAARESSHLPLARRALSRGYGAP